jgi:hypothetical protein
MQPEKKRDFPLSAAVRGELVEEIKRLAKERYLQLEIGTTGEFETLWREAFFGAAEGA